MHILAQVDVLLALSPRHNAMGEIVGVVGVGQDITEGALGSSAATAAAATAAHLNTAVDAAATTTTSKPLPPLLQPLPTIPTTSS